MSETKFTKGPWEVDPGDEFFDGACVTSKERSGMVEVCKIRCAYFDDAEMNGFEIEQKHNAYLIAAAPEMYEMLEELVRGGGLHELDEISIAKLLAKARGES